MPKIKMTPEEVATFWHQKSIELEEKLKDSEGTRRNLAIELGDLKNKYIALKLSTEEDMRKLEKCVDNERGRVYQKENDAYIYLKRWRQTIDELKAAQLTIADKNNQIRELTPKMTYEQIIDLKCENARLKEENAKFAERKRILDKFKIF